MRLLGYLYKKRFGLKIANLKQGDGEGACPSKETGCGVQRPPSGGL